MNQQAKSARFLYLFQGNFAEDRYMMHSYVLNIEENRVQQLYLPELETGDFSVILGL